MPSKNPIRLPPVYLLTAVVVMLAVDRIAPVAELWSPPWTRLGGLLVLLGFVLALSCAWLFYQRKTTIKPFEKPASLITDGLYRFSRNPIYVAMVILLMGIATLLGSLAPWLVLPVFAWRIQSAFIAHEEATLEQAFGDAYTQYCQRVRRWV